MPSSFFKRHEIYDVCTNIVNIKPQFYVDEAMKKEIARTMRTLPSYEMTVSERIFIKHNSLQRNEKLLCNWKAYVKNSDTRVRAPFHFPNAGDFRFHNCGLRYLPDLNKSPNKYRKKLKTGPGIDFAGQMPIPQELLFNRHDLGKPSIEKKKKWFN